MRDSRTDCIAVNSTLPAAPELHYLALCPRKLWWFSYGIEREHVVVTEIE